MSNKYLEETKETLNKIKEKSIKADLHYVVIWWVGPITNELNHRVAYFEDVNELFNYEKMLLNCYSEFKYYMSSDVIGIKNGGLFD